VSDFPPDLSELCKFVIKNLPGYENYSYNPEAAIINYYNMDSTIGGHTDHSEPNQVKEHFWVIVFQVKKIGLPF